MSPPAEGLLRIDKPAGPTSHDVVLRVRRLVGAARAGHTGTLDPAATGLLIVVLGAATRLARFVPGEPKRYSGALRLGLRTTTDDLEGQITERFGGALPDPASIRAGAASLVGQYAQVPPAFSARKLAGERLYRLARKGKPALGPAAMVDVGRFDLSQTRDPHVWAFVAEVSAGTYIRSLARDLGNALGCGGALAWLRRDSIGPFDVTDAIVLDDRLDLRDRLHASTIPLDRLPLDLPATRLDDVLAGKFVLGEAVRTIEASAPDGACAVFGPAGRLLGVGIRTADRLHPKVVLPVSRGAGASA